MVIEQKKMETNLPTEASMPPENFNSLSNLKSSSTDLSSSSASDAATSKSGNASLESLTEVLDSGRPSSNNHHHQQQGKESAKLNGYMASPESKSDDDNELMMIADSSSSSSNRESHLEGSTEISSSSKVHLIDFDEPLDSAHVLFQAEATMPNNGTDFADFDTHLAMNTNSELISTYTAELAPIPVVDRIESANLNGDEAKSEDVTPSNFGEIIELHFSKVKTNFNEFENFLRLYLYVGDVFHSDSTYEDDSMELFFQTTDEAFNRLHNPQHLDNPVYKMSLHFRHGIVRQNCSHQVKKKSIEIHLEKAKHVSWGALGISPGKSTSNNFSFKSRPSTATPFAHNKWTPCATVTEPGTPMTNNLAMVPYQEEEPIVPLLILSDATKGPFYGYTGLDNLGNTCFMNSVLQCLSNIDPLRDYFLSGQFKNDINSTNPLGRKGEIVKAYANFLKQLWVGQESSFRPIRIKSLTGEKITSMFLGYSQHDAQEFLAYFLDAIHEDLNKNYNKPKINYKTDDDNAEKELFDESDIMDEIKRPRVLALLKQKADDMWHQYRLFNNSIVIDLFCGQFKSILTCPDCSKKSIMFDPFLYIPLPIPPAKIPYEVIFFARHEETGMCKGATRFEVVLSHNATAGELLSLIASKTRVSTKSMRMIEQQDDHMSPKFLNSNWLLSDLRNDTVSSSKNRPLLVFEVYRDVFEEYTELCVIQRSLEKLQSRSFTDSRIGLPFIISIKKSMLTYHHLCSVLCSYASHSVSAHRPIFTHSSAAGSNELFSLSNFYPDELYKDENYRSLPHFVHYRSTMSTFDDVLSPFILRKPHFNGAYRNSEEEEIIPPLIHEILKEGSPTDGSDISDSESSTVVNSSNEEQEEQSEENENQQAILKQADSADESDLEMPSDEQDSDENQRSERIIQYDNDYILDLGNCYYISCDWIDISSGPPKIIVNLMEISRKIPRDLSLLQNDADITLDDCLQLFNEPEVLGPQNCWRCPSCKDLREATKQLSFWRLPPILVIQLKRFKMRNAIFRSKISQLVKYPINGLDLSSYQNGESVVDCNGEKVKPIYDLYAVVNHMGDAFMGHYTAFARSFDGKLGWRYFDDSRVVNADESRIVSHTAYLLFYKCRTSAAQ